MAGAYGSVPLDDLEKHLKDELGAVFKLDTHAIWMKVGLILESGARDCFDKSQDPDGAPWSPLAHPRVQGGSKPLLNQGLLRGSLTFGQVGHIHNETPDSLVWGTDYVSAAAHNFGVTITPKNGKFLTLPASLEAIRAGRIGNFPDSKRRLKWRVGPKGGVVFERLSGDAHKKAKSKIKKQKKGTSRTNESFIEKKGGGIEQIHYYLVKRVVIPRRQFIGIGPQQEIEISHVIQEEIIKSLTSKMRRI